MVEGLVLVLIKSVLSFMVQRALEDATRAPLEGMPRWYGQTVEGYVCESGMATGGMPRALDDAIVDANARLARRMQAAALAAAEDRVREARDDEERRIVQDFGRDEGAQRFVERNGVEKDRGYKDSGDRPAFARMCVELGKVERYQRTRLEQIAKTVSRHRHGRAQDELEAEIRALENPDTSTEKKP